MKISFAFNIVECFRSYKVFGMFCCFLSRISHFYPSLGLLDWRWFFLSKLETLCLNKFFSMILMQWILGILWLHFLNQIQRDFLFFFFENAVNSICFFASPVLHHSLWSTSSCLEFITKDAHLSWLRRGYTTSILESWVGLGVPGNFRFSVDNT